jgi:diadenylate cyclase
MAAILSGVSPVHDGAVVIRGERVAAAGVILPIPAESPVTRTMGTRHRAAWGVASDTDAVAVVVSEETGNVTVFHDRRLTPVGDMWELRRCLAEIFGVGKAA